MNASKTGGFGGYTLYALNGATVKKEKRDAPTRFNCCQTVWQGDQPGRKARDTQRM